jgi:hypothetical protein
MKLYKYMALSLLLSCLFHYGVIMALGRIPFREPGEQFRQEETSSPPPRLQLIDFRELTQRPGKLPEDRQQLQDDPSLSESTRAVGAELIRQVFEKEQLLEPPPLPTLRFAGVAPAVLAPKLPDSALPEPAATAPRPRIVELDFKDLPPARQARPLDLTPKLERLDVSDLKLPSLLPHGPLSSIHGGEYSVAARQGSVAKFQVPTLGDVELSVPESPETQLEPPVPFLATTTPLQTERFLPGDLEQGMIELSQPFDSFVNVDVLVYNDALRGGGYFKISITPKLESDSLRDIPKDTLLIIDHSLSISGSKFAQFQSAVIEALAYLNPKDRFNVVAFNDQPQPLFGAFAPALAEPVREGQRFVRGLRRGGMTDVFGCIAPLVQAGNGELQRPLNIFLLSDGQSTVNIYAADDFLRRMLGVNPGNVSIYPFSVGSEANRELLDFLGYLNRGYNYHVAELKDFRAQLVDYIATHSSLIINDLRYTAAGAVGRELYPKAIPHLYRRETLLIFGRFGPLEDELVLTLSGRDASGALRDLVFRRRYRDCLPAGPELPQQWAAQKILHLLAERCLELDPQARAQLQREIRQVAGEHSVFVPY